MLTQAISPVSIIVISHSVAENTLKSFLAACQAGASFVEFDLQVSSGFQDHSRGTADESTPPPLLPPFALLAAR
jgi:hypothetical protein